MKKKMQTSATKKEVIEVFFPYERWCESSLICWIEITNESEI